MTDTRYFTTAVAMLMVLAAGATHRAQAQSYSVPYAFPSFAAGAEPMGNPLIAGNKLYGTTDIGGMGEGPYGLGTIYQLDLQTGQETLLHSFAGVPSDGQYPYAGVISDSAGNLYGTTFFGGGHDLGTVFMLSATGSESVLHSFNGLDGAHPDCPLVRDAAGNLYGTATAGGISSSACLSADGVNHSCGTVFKLDPSGQLSTLHAFTGSPDGANPLGTLYLDAGNLYGTTWDGVASNAGTVFQIDVETGEETILYSFTGGGDGKFPSTGVIGDGKGTLYGGTTSGGGGNGVIFSLPVTGVVQTVLFTFSGIDGSDLSAVTLGSQGELYGTTYDGARGYGSVFELNSKSGALTTIHRFRGGADGANPTGLAQDAQGDLYGVTLDGGTARDGNIFRVTP